MYRRTEREIIFRLIWIIFVWENRPHVSSSQTMVHIMVESHFRAIQTRFVGFLASEIEREWFERTFKMLFRKPQHTVNYFSRVVMSKSQRKLPDALSSRIAQSFFGVGFHADIARNVVTTTRTLIFIIFSWMKIKTTRLFLYWLNIFIARTVSLVDFKQSQLTTRSGLNINGVSC